MFGLVFSEIAGFESHGVLLYWFWWSRDLLHLDHNIQFSINHTPLSSKHCSQETVVLWYHWPCGFSSSTTSSQILGFFVCLLHHVHTVLVVHWEINPWQGCVHSLIAWKSNSAQCEVPYLNGKLIEASAVPPVVRFIVNLIIKICLCCTENLFTIGNNGHWYAYRLEQTGTFSVTACRLLFHIRCPRWPTGFCSSWSVLLTIHILSAWKHVKAKRDVIPPTVYSALRDKYPDPHGLQSIRLLLSR